MSTNCVIIVQNRDFVKFLLLARYYDGDQL